MRRKVLMTVVAGSIACGALGGMTMGIASAAQSAVVHYKVIEKHFDVPSGASRLETVTCPTGLDPVGGGAHYGVNEWPALSQPAFAGIAQSDLSLNHRGWTVNAWVNSSQGTTSFTADVVCASW